MAHLATASEFPLVVRPVWAKSSIAYVFVFFVEGRSLRARSCREGRGHIDWYCAHTKCFCLKFKMRCSLVWCNYSSCCCSSGTCLKVFILGRLTSLASCRCPTAGQVHVDLCMDLFAGIGQPDVLHARGGTTLCLQQRVWDVHAFLFSERFIICAFPCAEHRRIGMHVWYLRVISIFFRP